MCQTHCITCLATNNWNLFYVLCLQDMLFIAPLQVLYLFMLHMMVNDIANIIMSDEYLVDFMVQ